MINAEIIPLKWGRMCLSNTKPFFRPTDSRILLLACAYRPSLFPVALDSLYCKVHFQVSIFEWEPMRLDLKMPFCRPPFGLVTGPAPGFWVNSFFLRTLETVFHCFLASVVADEKFTNSVFVVSEINLFFFLPILFSLMFCGCCCLVGCFIHDKTRISLYLSC